MIKAVLSSAQHPEYGEVTISFPIPRKEYDHTMELLEGLDIGDALAQDCRVVEIDSRYPVLNRLEGIGVNVDELDYLAKRLDSFCKGERDQFLAMAHKLDVADIQDFINLTFCCQQATVITDFSNLEAVGRAHYMNLRGGCASSEELADLNAMCLAIRMLEPRQREKLEAVVCAVQPDHASEVRRLAEELEQFDFIPDIHTAEEYGKYMIRESGHFEYDANLEGFYNYAQYGSEHIKAEGGLFTSRGYVAYQGTIPLLELMQDDPAEQHRQEQGPQMGGLA